jgi:hypothetical protein
MRMSKGGITIGALEDMTSHERHDWIVSFSALLKDEQEAQKRAYKKKK